MRDHQARGEQRDRQHEVHHHARAEDDAALPLRLGGQALRVARVFFAQEPHEGADRQRVDRVIGVAPAEAPDARRQSDAGFEHRRAEELGRHVVAAFVHDEERQKDKDEWEKGLGQYVQNASAPLALVLN